MARASASPGGGGGCERIWFLGTANHRFPHPSRLPQTGEGESTRVRRGSRRPLVQPESTRFFSGFETRAQCEAESRSRLGFPRGRRTSKNFNQSRGGLGHEITNYVTTIRASAWSRPRGHECGGSCPLAGGFHGTTSLRGHVRRQMRRDLSRARERPSNDPSTDRNSSMDRVRWRTHAGRDRFSTDAR